MEKKLRKLALIVGTLMGVFSSAYSMSAELDPETDIPAPGVHARSCWENLGAACNGGEHAFDVTLENGSIVTLDEYLQGERTPILNVKNLSILFMQDPLHFVKLVLKSIPHEPKTVTKLGDYYRDRIKISELIQTLPAFESPTENLACINIERAICLEIMQKSRRKIRGSCYDDATEQSGSGCGGQLSDGESLETNWLYVSNLVEAQLQEDLRNYFSLVNELDARDLQEVVQNVREVVQNATDYMFTVYRLVYLGLATYSVFFSDSQGSIPNSVR